MANDKYESSAVREQYSLKQVAGKLQGIEITPKLLQFQDHFLKSPLLRLVCVRENTA